MARPTEEADVTSLVDAMLAAMAASAAERGVGFSETIARDGVQAMCKGIVSWVRARETDDLEIDTSGLKVTIEAVDYPVTGTATIT